MAQSDLAARLRVKIPAAESNDLIAHLLELPTPPKLDLPEALQFERVQVMPTPHLIVRKPTYAFGSQSRLEADLSFDYAGLTVSSSDRREGFYNRDARRFVERDRKEEERALESLKTLGFRSTQDYNLKQKLSLSSKHLPRAVTTLLGKGWRVEAEGKLYRKPSVERICVPVSTGRVAWPADFGEGLGEAPAL